MPRKQVVKANERFIPPFYGTGGTLYLRPFVIGTGDNIGVGPAPEYLFCIFAIPVGAYFKGGMSPVNFCIIADCDRAKTSLEQEDKKLVETMQLQLRLMKKLRKSDLQIVFT